MPRSDVETTIEGPRKTSWGEVLEEKTRDLSNHAIPSEFPKRLHGPAHATESIDLNSLFTKNVTDSGSFDLRGAASASLSRLLHALPIPSFLIDRSFSVLFANQACRKIGVDTENIEGSSFGSLFVDPRSARENLSVIEDVFESRRPQIRQAELGVGRISMWGKIHFRSIRLGDYRAILALVEDLSLERAHLRLKERHERELQKARKDLEQRVKERTGDLRRAQERLLQSERLKVAGELAGAVAHNFNNVLQVVMGGAQLALENLKAGEISDAKKNLELIIDGSRSAGDLVKRLKSFAKQRPADEPTTPEIFDVSELFRQAVEMTRLWWLTIPDSNVRTVSFHLDLKPGCLVQGHESEVFELIVNLVKAAACALPNGGSVEGKTLVRSGEVIIQVTNAGEGVLHEELTQVFAPSWSKKGVQGSGMGLAACSGIVGRHGGRFSVETIRGKGSTFTVKLPLVSKPAEKAEPLEESDFDLKLSILVIDDTPQITAWLKEGLTKRGQKVITASTGLAGLRAFSENPVDLVICDYSMPEMNGLDVAHTVKRICNERGVPQTPFILLSGGGIEVPTDERRVPNGVDRVLEKPIDIPRLLTAVRNLVSTR